MTALVIGLGDTAKGWFNTKRAVSLGVNDCSKFGYTPDYLVVIDSPKRFTKDRQQTIFKTQSNFICRDDQWRGLIKEYQKIRLQQFSKYLKKGHVYCSKTSTFVAMSIAFNMGAKDIVLFGVDFVNHHIFKPGNKLFDYEMRQYERFVRMLNEQGTKVFVSSSESRLSQFLPVYESNAVNA